jgi:hypothetical protein
MSKNYLKYWTKRLLRIRQKMLCGAGVRTVMVAMSWAKYG